MSITFRPTDKAERSVKDLVEKLGYNQSRAVNYALETHAGREVFIEKQMLKLETYVVEFLGDLEIPLVRFVRQLEKRLNPK